MSENLASTYGLTIIVLSCYKGNYYFNEDSRRVSKVEREATQLFNLQSNEIPWDSRVKWNYVSCLKEDFESTTWLKWAPFSCIQCNFVTIQTNSCHKIRNRYNISI